MQTRTQNVLRYKMKNFIKEPQVGSGKKEHNPLRVPHDIKYLITIKKQGIFLGHR